MEAYGNGQQGRYIALRLVDDSRPIGERVLVQRDVPITENEWNTICENWPELAE